jgi:hypothetical protein
MARLVLHRTFVRNARSVSVAILLVVAFTTQPSRADTAIAADLDYAIPVDSNADTGAGFGIRVGPQFHVPLLVLTPELAFTYHGFAGDFGPRVYRGTAGLRVGVGEVIRPGVFAHLGVGRMTADSPVVDAAHTAFTYDAGIFLDFTLLPLLNIGVHAAYNHLNGESTSANFQWVTLGAHAALVF